jgi:cobyrinic acid a,c-diamide synthase
MRSHVAMPRVVIAGLAGDAGKTLVSAGLIRALRRRRIRVAPFKKGPDYIDPAWLATAAGRAAQNLDTYLMSETTLVQSLADPNDDVAVIEGNRGLFDGQDVRGTHSTAELAKRLQAPIVLVVDVSKSTRTIAAMVLGCLALDPALPLAGVILNRVGTRRQEQLIRDVLANATPVPVLGAIPRLSADLIPARHLGLVLPAERPDAERVLDAMADAVEHGVDLEAILHFAQAAPALPCANVRPRPAPTGDGVRIGILKDEAFCFYYSENLAALEAGGATLIPISPLHDQRVPDLDALYAGGGYPEEHALALSANIGFRASLADTIASGLPVWAECGGLMYLARTLSVKGLRLPMVGVLPVDVEQTVRCQGHGYVEATVDVANPFFSVGTRLRGHEFHYSKVASDAPGTVLSLGRGVGVGGARDGLVRDRIFASYLHVFAPGTPEWAPSLLRLAREAQLLASLNPIATGDPRGIDIGSGPAN